MVAEERCSQGRSRLAPIQSRIIPDSRYVNFTEDALPELRRRGPRRRRGNADEIGKTKGFA